MVAEPISGLEELFGDIGRFLNNLFVRIANSIENAFQDVINSLNSMINAVMESLRNIVREIEDIVGNIFAKIQEFIETTITQIIAFIDEVLMDVIEGIVSLVDASTNYIKTLTSDVIGFFQDLMSDAGQFMSDTFDKVWTSITTIVDQVQTLFTDLFDTVVSHIESFVDDVKLFLGDLFNLISAGVNAILAEGQEVVNAITQAVKDFISEVVDTVGGALRDLLDTISNLPAEIAELANRLTDTLAENVGNPLLNLPISLITEITEAFTGEPVTDLDRAQMDTLNLLFGTSPVPRTPELFREGIERSMPSNPFVKGIVTAFVSPLIILQLISGIATANSQIVLQEHALENPYRLMEPPDLIRSKHFDLLSQDNTITDLRKHGYTDSDAKVMLQIGETVAPEAEQVIWWLRGISTTEEFENALLAHGWTNESIDKLKQSAFFLPPVQDLITMSVREVFTPEIAEKFGQFEDLPTKFVEQAEKVGLSPEWAMNYWAAHWTLPSVQMGFEMMHRRVIDESEMQMLLKSADVMPFWRDKLVAISFNPLTRVDIRRMHKLGVLTESQVLSAYMDIGYNKANADLLLDFTIQLNKPSEAQDDQDLSKLTRGNIVGFFTDGLLNRQEANELLINLGLSVDAANLYLDSAEMDQQRGERRAEINIILDQADTGTITFEEAQDKLHQLGLETQEIQLALTDLNQREAKRNKLPSLSDLNKMYRKDIISDAEYLDTVKRLGYSDLWSGRYLQLIKG